MKDYHHQEIEASIKKQVDKFVKFVGMLISNNINKKN